MQFGVLLDQGRFLRVGFGLALQAVGLDRIEASLLGSGPPTFDAGGPDMMTEKEDTAGDDQHGNQLAVIP